MSEQGEILDEEDAKNIIKEQQKNLAGESKQNLLKRIELHDVIKSVLSAGFGEDIVDPGKFGLHKERKRQADVSPESQKYSKKFEKYI